MIMVFVVIAGIVLIFLILSYLTKKHNRKSPSEIADIIERFIEGKGSKWDWDDFICSPVNDPDLDKIRIRCAQLGHEYPPTKPGQYTNEEGIRILKQYVEELKSK